MNRNRALAVIFVAFGAVVACSSSDDSLGQPQPQQPDAGEAGAPTTNDPPPPITATSDAGANDPLDLKWNPSFEPDYNKLEANPAAQVVTKDEQDAVTVTPTRLEIPVAQGADMKTWEVGRIVVGAPGAGAGNNPLGFARRVTAVREENGKVIVDTETVGLEDLASGEFQFRFDPNDPEAKDVDLAKLDPTWAGKNLYNPAGPVFTPGSHLLDNFPAVRKLRKIPGQPGWWDDLVEGATDIVNTIADGVEKAVDTIGSKVNEVLDELGNIIPKSFIASAGMTDTIEAYPGTLLLFDNLNYEKTLNGKGSLPMKFSVKGNGRVFSAMTFNPGFQIGARIPNYLHPDRETFQTWVNVDSFAQAQLDIKLDLEAKLESAGGLAGSALEQKLNETSDYAQNVLSQQRETLFGDPDVKPAGGWKKTLYLSKPKVKTFFAGPVPVVVTATTQVDLECGFEAKGTIHTRVLLDQQATLKFKAIYDETGGSRIEGPAFQTQRRKELELTGGGSVMIACGLIPRINTFLYDTVGLNVGVRVSAVAKAEYASTCTSKTTTKPQGKLDMSVAANIGVQVGARFQAPGSSAAGIKGQSAGFDIGPIEPWNTEVVLGSWSFPGTGIGYCTPLCSDGKLSPGEIDVDCGGDACSRCTTGQKCKLNTDCYAPGSCNNGICKVDPCADHVLSGDETDVDCGGKTCGARCAVDKACSQNTDCTNGLFCNAKTRRCTVSSCTDGIKNGDESGIDCGGKCALCGKGAPSTTSQGCATGFTNGRFCVASACQNQQRDQNEGGVDCGGTSACGKCHLGWNCNINSDCESFGTQQVICSNATRRCEKYIPPTPTCDDGLKGPTESDVDCGGTCATKCANDKACTIPEDCASSSCVNKVCKPIVPPGLVFVTSTKQIASFGGLAGADAICNNLASAASITGTFKAFLADSTTGPAARMTRRGGYKLKNGALVAFSPEEFFGFAHRLPIDVDETGAQLTQSERIWTGTNGAGTTTGNWCNDWTKPFGTEPPLGISDATDSSWAGSSAPSFCDAVLRLYCVEQ